nr:GDSL-type esterase/lipase family protein [uncultured Gemmiger sp.]
MSRNGFRGASFSPTQRRACLVLVLCVLAVIITFVCAWLVPGLLGAGGKKDSYDSSLYPVDTSLDAVLKEASSSDSSYASSVVYVGDDYTASLKSAGQISLNQYLGKEGLSVSKALQESCIYFEGDSNSYTIPQALAKMKPRRIVITLGSNDLSSGLTADVFVQDYKHMVEGFATAYSYCDIIVNSIPPVTKDSQDAAASQLLIDQYNQALAVMCNDAGYKFLNSAEVLKDETGYADTSMISGNAYTTTGAKELVNYVVSHAYDTEDRRPDTDDIPTRAEAASQSSSTTPTATPTATPSVHKVTFEIEDGKGTLNGNGQTGVTKLEFEVPDGETVTVEAVPADGYTFFGWSDGIKNTKWVKKVTQDISVTAMFNQKTTATLTIDEGNQTMNMGDSITFHATLIVNDQAASADNVQWAVNGDLVRNGYSFAFTPTATGTYTIKAGVEIDGVYASQEVTVTVADAPTKVSITGVSSMPAGSSTTLTATVENQSGDITWSCPQKPDWSATGNSVQFTANGVGEYTIRATNNGKTAEFKLTVTEAAPTPSPSSDNKGDKDDD